MSLTTRINRRQLVGLDAASLLVVTGCSTFRRSSDLEKQRDELRNLLDEIAENHGEQVRLASIARRIEIRARELVSENQEFVGNFDSLMKTRDVTETQLRWAIDSYSDRRMWLRNDLLQLQDELHQALEPDEWAEVVEILNHASHSLTTYIFHGSLSMPVLITLATINVLFRGGSVVSFLDPAMLRASIESELEDSNAQDAALQLVDKIEEIASQYDKSFAASLEAYVRESMNAESTAEDLIATLEPWDNTRQSKLLEIVGIRQAMLDTVSDSEWDKIFG